jgi:RND family efflux transporter MFP subunit
MSQSDVPVRDLEAIAYAIPWYVRIFILPVAIVVGTGAVVGTVIASRGGVESAAPEESVLPVKVLQVAADNGPSTIVATGTVVPGQQITLTPEVTGKLREVSPKLVPGGRFGKGEVIARIDGTNYVAALRTAEQSLEAARLELRLEEGRAAVAEREWNLLGPADRAGRDPDLALRKPQLAVARASVRAAEAHLDRAQMDVSRTRLVAPFDSVVVQEAVDVGQVVSLGTQVATLVGSTHARVTVSIPVDQLDVVEVAGQPNAAGQVPERGTAATVIQALADGSQVVRQGEVIGVSGQLDPQTRTALLTVDIPGALDPALGSRPLLPGAFVSVELQGAGIGSAYRLPRTALSDGDTVWVVDAESTLQRRSVSVAWSLPDAVVLRDGISPGDQVVVSAMSNPLVGQRVSVQTANDNG